MAAITRNYNIKDCAELRSEVDRYQDNPDRLPSDLDWERYVITRSTQLGCPEVIPDDWMMVDDE